LRGADTVPKNAQALIYFAVIAGLLLQLVVPIGIQRYRISRTAAFCDAIEALPPSELDRFASGCDRLMWEHGGPARGLDFVRDTNILARFSIAGRTPYEIVLEKGNVGIKNFKGGWRYSDLLLWGEDYASNGDRIRTLKITYGDHAWRTLCEREGGHRESNGAPKLRQPTGSPTNSAAGSQR
jgi:hypothetical protein